VGGWCWHCVVGLCGANNISEGLVVGVGASLQAGILTCQLLMSHPSVVR
jgi:hypothetical protein